MAKLIGWLVSVMLAIIMPIPYYNRLYTQTSHELTLVIDLDKIVYFISLMYLCQPLLIYMHPYLYWYLYHTANCAAMVEFIGWLVSVMLAELLLISSRNMPVWTVLMTTGRPWYLNDTSTMDEKRC